MQITKENNFYIVEDYDIMQLITKLKENKKINIDPDLYLLLYNIEGPNKFRFHQFFALENYILARKAKELEYAIAIYQHTHVKDLFKRKEIEQPKESPIINRELKIYQKLAAENYEKYKSLLHLDGYILYMQPGMGKTTTAIVTALSYSDKHVIILVPKTLKVSSWAAEFDQIQYNDYALFPEQKDFADKKFIITNYEQITKLNNIECDFLIIDESQNFRFADRKKIQDIYAFKKRNNLHNILLLSGTPIKGKYSEFSAAFLLLDPYFDMDAYPYFYALYNKKNIAGEELLKERLTYYLYKLSYDAVKDEFVLPKMTKITEEIELLNANEFTIAHIKQELKKKAEDCSKKINKPEVIQQINQKIAKYNKKIDESMSIEKMLEIKIELFAQIQDKQERKELNELFNQIIVPNLYCLSKNIARTYINKLVQLVIELFKSKINQIKELYNNGEKIVIFTQYIIIAEQLKQLFDKELNADVKIVTGNYSLDERTQNIKKFKESQGGDIIIITYKSASYGLTLTEARYMFYADPPNRDVDLQQAIARIYRLTQTRESFIIYLKLKANDITIQDRKEFIINTYKQLVEELLDKPLDNHMLDELYERFKKEIKFT